jgi:RNA ligase
MYNGLFTQEELDREIESGYVRSREHPDDNEMWILNYTEKAAFESHWNNVTLNCRGLVIGPLCNIIARPFPKFFNYGQSNCPVVDLDEPAIVSDKMDGSLGILYKIDGQLAIATRGSFTSDQAIHATEILRTKYSDFKPLPGWTYLFEIIYPENRIVCDYVGMDDLVLLGMVHIETGGTTSTVSGNWPGPTAGIFQWETLRQALAAKPRKGAEGFVVHLLNSDVRVKIKQEDYIALHRIVTGLNARSVWEAMLTDSIDELIEKVPDEFHDFVHGVQEDIQAEVDEFVEFICNRYNRIRRIMEINNESTKRDFALRAKNDNYSWALFNLWDGKAIESELLKRAKPKHDYSPIRISNDAD